MSKPLTSLEDALAACLDDLARGASPAQCLARFPEHAAELAPLLRIAARAQAQPLPVLSQSGRVRGRERMQAALAQRAAGSGWLRAWVSGLAVAAVLLALAAGAWLSWPGRDKRLGGESTAQPAPPTMAATAPPSAIPTPTLEMRSRSTPTLASSPTSEGAPTTATGTSTPGPTLSATATPSPTASATPSPGPLAIPTSAPSAEDTAPPVAPTRSAATATRSPAETPEARETAESAEPPEPTETHEPSSATPAPPTVAPRSQPTERLEVTLTPGPGLAATSTPDDDDHKTPEPPEPPDDEGRIKR